MNDSYRIKETPPAQAAGPAEKPRLAAEVYDRWFRKKKDPEVLRKYLTYLLLEQGLSENTRLAYERDVRRFFDFMEEEGLRPEEVQLDHLHRFMCRLADMGIGARSVARVASGVRSFYGFLVLDGYTDRDPTELLRSPQIGKHLPEVLTLAEVDAILEAVDISHPDGQRDRAIIEVLYSCGLRVSELCELRLSDLFLSDRYIRVTGKGSKQRLVPISDKAVAELERWFEARAEIEPKPGEEDYVFISQKRRQHLSRITVFHNLRVFAERAGIGKTISPHTFRHTFATHMLEGGANLRFIQLMLGHANIDTTEIYTHLDMRFLRQQVLDYFPRNRRQQAEP